MMMICIMMMTCILMGIGGSTAARKEYARTIATRTIRGTAVPIATAATSARMEWWVPAQVPVFEAARTTVTPYPQGLNVVAAAGAVKIRQFGLLSVPAAKTATKIAGATAGGSLIQATNVARATTGAITASSRRVYRHAGSNDTIER
eukprot:443078_1